MQFEGRRYAYVHIEAIDRGEKIDRIMFFSILNPNESILWLGDLDALAPLSRRATVTALPLESPEEPEMPSLSEKSLAVHSLYLVFFLLLYRNLCRMM